MPALQQWIYCGDGLGSFVFSVGSCFVLGFFLGFFLFALLCLFGFGLFFYVGLFIGGDKVGVYIYFINIYMCTYESMHILKCQIAISRRCRVSRVAAVRAIHGCSWGRVRCPLEEALFVLPAE